MSRDDLIAEIMATERRIGAPRHFKQDLKVRSLESLESELAKLKAMENGEANHGRAG